MRDTIRLPALCAALSAALATTSAFALGKAPWYLGEYATRVDMESFARGRILSLLGYLQTLQEPGGEAAAR